jgi:hypothetical protein
MTDLRCREGRKTHSGMRPQSRTLEAPIADNLRGMDETDRRRWPPCNMAEGSGREESIPARHKPRKGNMPGGQHGLRA